MYYFAIIFIDFVSKITCKNWSQDKCTQLNINASLYFTNPSNGTPSLPFSQAFHGIFTRRFTIFSHFATSPVFN